MGERRGKGETHEEETLPAGPGARQCRRRQARCGGACGVVPQGGGHAVRGRRAGEVGSGQRAAGDGRRADALRNRGPAIRARGKWQGASGSAEPQQAAPFPATRSMLAEQPYPPALSANHVAQPCKVAIAGSLVYQSS